MSNLSLPEVSAEQLGSIIQSKKVRNFVYGIYVIFGLILGSWLTYLITTASTVPMYLIGILGVYGFIGIPVAGLAKANVANPVVKMSTAVDTASLTVSDGTDSEEDTDSEQEELDDEEISTIESNSSPGEDEGTDTAGAVEENSGE